MLDKMQECRFNFPWKKMMCICMSIDRQSCSFMLVEPGIPWYHQSAHSLVSCLTLQTDHSAPLMMLFISKPDMVIQS